MENRDIQRDVDLIFRVFDKDRDEIIEYEDFFKVITTYIEA